MAEHELKCWPDPFAAVWSGTKRHEVRKNDRPFAVDDHLRLREYDPATDSYSGAWILARITYVTQGGAWGLPPDVCVLSIEKVAKQPPDGHSWSLKERKTRLDGGILLVQCEHEDCGIWTLLRHDNTPAFHFKPTGQRCEVRFP